MYNKSEERGIKFSAVPTKNRKELTTMNNIKSERIRHNLTQEQVSNITGVPVRTIQNWESGIRKCPDYVEKMILDKLNQMFDQPDYKTILEEILEMLKSDMTTVIQNIMFKMSLMKLKIH